MDTWRLGPAADVDADEGTGGCEADGDGVTVLVGARVSEFGCTWSEVKIA
ncbi:hypothetical protein JL475_32225 [Streptomyces sp. M2CJ-2]|nr:hypothetical protein [Streptomyces sp. M2CJ-2]MBL3670561.1 hypothetical protein [Streptomyces sp. M2CJ-2]